MLDDGLSGRDRASDARAQAESTDEPRADDARGGPSEPGISAPGSPAQGPVAESKPFAMPKQPAGETPESDDGTAESHADPPNVRDEPAKPTAAGNPDGGDGAPPAADALSRRERKRKAKQAKPRRKAPWWELPALVLLAILIAIGVKTFVVQPFYIPSQSMEKTLHGCPGCHGDRILVNKPIYDLRDPHPGDIVVFHAPTGWDDEPVSQPPSNPLLRVVRGFGQLVGFVPPDGQVLVKRIIATGGQTVKGDAAGHVQISTNGAKGPYRTLNEPYVFIDKGQGHSLRSFGPVTVPKGRLWVMGDHRNDSADSRYHCGPGGTDSGNDSNCNLFAKEATVPVDDVIGKAFLIAWPPSRWRTLGTPSTFQSAAASAAPVVPAAAASAIVFPIYIVRRRRRHTHR
jgi:signal peptidase I